MRKKKDMLKRERYVKVHAAERMMRCLASWNLGGNGVGEADLQTEEKIGDSLKRSLFLC